LGKIPYWPPPGKNPSDAHGKHYSITFNIIEHIEVADEFITSENPELTRDFIIKPRHPGRLKKQTWVEKNPQWEPRGLMPKNAYYRNSK